MTNNSYAKLVAPNEENKVLLHSCCAPCACSLIETMLTSGIEPTIFYYNPNIFPKEEYEIRKRESKRFADKKGVPFIDCDYDNKTWMERVRGFEDEPERGKRCDICFDIRFKRTALFAYENGFKVFTSGLGISRWKNLDQINNAGIKAASQYPGLIYWDYNWRKKGGSQRMYEISKCESFYKQEYCGCIYSLRDANKWRKEHNQTEIEINKSHY